MIHPVRQPRAITRVFMFKPHDGCEQDARSGRSTLSPHHGAPVLGISNAYRNDHEFFPRHYRQPECARLIGGAQEHVGRSSVVELHLQSGDRQASASLIEDSSDQGTLCIVRRGRRPTSRSRGRGFRGSCDSCCARHRRRPPSGRPEPGLDRWRRLALSDVIRRGEDRGLREKRMPVPVEQKTGNSLGSRYARAGLCHRIQERMG